MSSQVKPVAAQYLSTFLKPEMLHIYRQITALREYRPVVVARKRENAAAFPFEPVITFRRSRIRALRRFWQKTVRRGPIYISSGEARRLGAALDRQEAMLLHVYFGHIAVHLLPFLRNEERPFVVSFHGADAGRDVQQAAHSEPLREVFERAALVLARSEALGDDLADLGCPREKLRIHRTGIPLEAFHFSQRRAPEDGAWHFVQACRLIPKKGIETALRAFAHFARDFPAARFTVAGEGPLRAALLQLAASLGIGEQVRFAGFLSQEDLRALYNQAHFFLHPSQTGPDGDREGVPNSLLEAMATGLPVLATRHGGIPEAVESGISGLLVPEGASDDLAAAMFSLARDPDLYASMSEAAAQAIGENWEIQAQTQRLEMFYGEALRPSLS